MTDWAMDLTCGGVIYATRSIFRRRRPARIYDSIARSGGQLTYDKHVKMFQPAADFRRLFAESAVRRIFWRQTIFRQPPNF